MRNTQTHYGVLHLRAKKRKETNIFLRNRWKFLILQTLRALDLMLSICICLTVISIQQLLYWKLLCCCHSKGLGRQRTNTCLKRYPFCVWTENYRLKLRGRNIQLVLSKWSLASWGNRYYLTFFPPFSTNGRFATRQTLPKTSKV